MAGQIVDATLVAAPKQRNTAGERQAIKAGRTAAPPLTLRRAIRFGDLHESQILQQQRRPAKGKACRRT